MRAQKVCEEIINFLLREGFKHQVSKREIEKAIMNIRGIDDKRLCLSAQPHKNTKSYETAKREATNKNPLTPYLFQFLPYFSNFPNYKIPSCTQYVKYHHTTQKENYIPQISDYEF